MLPQGPFKEHLPELIGLHRILCACLSSVEGAINPVGSCEASGNLKNENLPSIPPIVPVGNQVRDARVDVFPGVALKTAILHILDSVHQTHHLLGNVILLLYSENDHAALSVCQGRDGLHKFANRLIDLWGKLPLVLQVSVFMALLSN